MPPPTLPSGDPRRPAEARPHPPSATRRGADGQPAAPDLRSMLATLLAILAIIGKVRAAAWAAAIVLLSAAVNLERSADAGSLISALPAVVFGFVAIYRPPPSSSSPAANPMEALKALVGRFTGR